jgi:DNA-binding transcriptional LysR family regulator
MVTLRQLTHARALARLHSFRQAAEALHLSQPALTRSIHALERSLGVALFDRLHNGVVPTSVGELFLRGADSVLKAHDDLCRDIQLAVGLGSGTLDLSTGPYPGDVLVSRAATAMAAKHPGLSYRLRNGNWREVAAQVIAREAELGIAELSVAQSDERLQTEPVGRHGLFLYCRTGHPLLALREITLPRIASFPWVTSRLPSRIVRGLGMVVCKAGRLDHESDTFVPTYEVDVISAAKQIVAESDALGGALLTQIESEVEEGKLSIVPYHADWLELDYGFIRLRDRTASPAASLFMEEFRRVDAALAAHEAELRRRYGVDPARAGTALRHP